MWATSALICLALNVYHEARGESKVGQRAVAEVTMNRAKTEHNVCRTVAARKQFSWTSSVFSEHSAGWYLSPEAKPVDPRAWGVALSIAKNVLKERPRLLLHGATHFHSITVSPKWMSQMELVATIGNHLFYRERRE